MYIVVNERLRRYLPKNIYSSLEDPLVNRYWYGDPGEVWTADVVISGRGKNRKLAIAMENAQCGYRILIPMPSEVDCEEFRSSIMGKMQNALINSFKDYAIPQSKINAYICTNFSYFHIVKAKPSRPSQNVEEFSIGLQMMYKDGLDPFKSEFNRTDRKFGNSWEYRSVENATYEMLGMTGEEARKAFLTMYRS